MWELDLKEVWALKNWWFWTVVLEKTLESPLDSRRSNQSILKETSPGCSLEGLMLKLKLQYFGHLMLRVNSSDMSLSKLWETVRTGKPGGLHFTGSQRIGQDLAAEQQQLFSTSSVPDAKSLHSSVHHYSILWICFPVKPQCLTAPHFTPFHSPYHFLTHHVYFDYWSVSLH